MMNETKKPWLSKGIIGSAVTIVLGIGAMTGLFVPEASQHAEQATNLLYGIVVSITGLLSLWGRIKAQKKISLK
jgi:hypothetical protein